MLCVLTPEFWTRVDLEAGNGTRETLFKRHLFQK